MQQITEVLFYYLLLPTRERFVDRPVGIGGGGRCPLTQLFDENVRLNLLVIYVHVRTYLLVILYLVHTRKNQRTKQKSKHAT